MEDNHLAKITRDSHPLGMRSRGRPKKCWKESLIKPLHLNLWKNRRSPIEKKKKKKKKKKFSIKFVK